MTATQDPEVGLLADDEGMQGVQTSVFVKTHPLFNIQITVLSIIVFLEIRHNMTSLEV